MRTSWISVTLSSLALLIISGCAVPITTREKGALAGGALGALGGGLIGVQMYGQSVRQHDMTYRLEQQQREIERQRQELEALRRDYERPLSSEPYSSGYGGRREPYSSAY